MSIASMKSAVPAEFTDLPTAVPVDGGVRSQAASGNFLKGISIPSGDGRATKEPASLTLPGVKRSSSREVILDAAETVVIAEGAAHLTLDAVAERAGVSKGGLLYHFPSKELLLAAMVDRHMLRFDALRLQALATLPPEPGRELKALILSAHSKCMEAEKCLSSGMLAALANRPQLLEPVRAAHRRRVASLAGDEAAGLSFERTAAIALAVDGMCLLEMLEVSPYSADDRRRILNELLLLVDEAVGSAAVRPARPF